MGTRSTGWAGFIRGKTVQSPSLVQVKCRKDMNNYVSLTAMGLKKCGWRVPEPFPKRQILDTSKLKEFVEENFKFDENRKKFPKLVENTVGNGEIACYEQFLLFPQCFQKTCIADT